MIRSNDRNDILFRTFAEITSLISSGKDNRIIFQKILDTALDLLPAEKCYLIFLESHRIYKYAAQLRDRGKRMTVEDMPESIGILNWLHREMDAMRAPDSACMHDLSLIASECIREDDSRGRVISAPLTAKSSLFGILTAINDVSKRPFSDDDIHLLKIMSNQAAIALENYMLYKKLEVESITDGLTGVFNYRFLIRSIKLEMKRADRFGYRFSFLMLDVDNLKEYNDRNGHLSGSRALSDIARIITNNCREIDFVAKYGGDEFALMLPQTGVQGALSLAERILRAVESFKFNGATAGLLTCSIGISVYPDDAGDVEGLIDRADIALYHAKSLGKNTVKRYDEAHETGRLGNL